MIYKFVLISDEEEDFFREFELDEHNTLLDFHSTIQEELEYDKSIIAVFFTANDDWEKEEEFTLFDMGSNTTLMEEVSIDEIIINKKQKLAYIFDLLYERAFFIECLGEVDLINEKVYPICTQSKGKPPKQSISNIASNINLKDGVQPVSGLNIDDEDNDSDFEKFDNIDDF